MSRAVDTGVAPSAVVQAISRHASAVVPIRDLPGALGIGPAEVAEVLAALIASRAIESWPDAPEGPSVVLSGAAARALGLSLHSPDERSMRGRGLRWLEREKPERPRGLTETDLTAARDAAGLAPIGAAGEADPSPSPLDALALAGTIEQLEAVPSRGGIRVARRVYEGNPDRWKPSLILGLGVVWPVTLKPGEPCPGCGGHPPRNAACVLCDLSGVDPWLPPAPAPAKPPKPRPRRVGANLAGGTGEARPDPAEVKRVETARPKKPKGARGRRRGG